MRAAINKWGGFSEDIQRYPRHGLIWPSVSYLLAFYFLNLLIYLCKGYLACKQQAANPLPGGWSVEVRPTWCVFVCVCGFPKVVDQVEEAIFVIGVSAAETEHRRGFLRVQAPSPLTRCSLMSCRLLPFTKDISQKHLQCHDPPCISMLSPLGGQMHVQHCRKKRADFAAAGFLQTYFVIMQIISLDWVLTVN